MTNGKKQEDFLLKELARTGLPLELEVADFLEKDWLVFNEEAYVDEDEEKTREIDVFAIHETETDQHTWTKPPRLFVGTDLAVECKRSETHAWVFLTRKKATPPGFGSGQTVDFLEAFSNGHSSFLKRGDWDLPKLHFDATEKIAHAGTPLKLRQPGGGGRGDRDDIFEARNQLMKYSNYFKKGRRERISGDPTRRDIFFLFLAIVFDGQLYEATNENGKLGLRPADKILLRSGRYSKTTGEYLTHLVDVIRREHFPEYVKTLNKDIALLRDKFTWEAKDLTAKADDAVDTLPNPPKIF